MSQSNPRSAFISLLASLMIVAGLCGVSWEWVYFLLLQIANHASPFGSSLVAACGLWSIALTFCGLGMTDRKPWSLALQTALAGVGGMFGIGALVVAIEVGTRDIETTPFYVLAAWHLSHCVLALWLFTRKSVRAEFR